MNDIALSVVSVALAALVVLTGASAQDLKIGIVDMREVFAAYYNTKDAEQDLNEGKTVAKQQLDERNAKYKSLISKWQEMQKMIADPQLNEVLREQKQKEANAVAAEAKALEREMAEFRSRRERQLREQVMRMRKGIHDEIKKVVFQITNIERSTNGISLTWNSRKGREYSVEYGLTLDEAAWIEVADGVLGLEDATTFVDDDAGRAGLPSGYYRVRED